MFIALQMKIRITSCNRLESGTGQPVEITDVNIPAPYFSSETKNEGNDVILELSINGSLIPANLNRSRDVLIVHTTSAEVPALQFIIEWNVMPVIVASPERIIWNGDAGTEFRTVVSLRHLVGKTFKITGIHSTSPCIRTFDKTQDSATEHKLEVVMAADAKVGMYREKLTVTLDDPEQNALEVDIVAVLR